MLIIVVGMLIEIGLVIIVVIIIATGLVVVLLKPMETNLSKDLGSSLQSLRFPI
jgi:type II secretory pathway pseudopilin PulG